MPDIEAAKSKLRKINIFQTKIDNQTRWRIFILQFLFILSRQIFAFNELRCKRWISIANIVLPLKDFAVFGFNVLYFAVLGHDLCHQGFIIDMATRLIGNELHQTIDIVFEMLGRIIRTRIIPTK